MMIIKNFLDCIKESENYGRPHLLLGNGFSIALHEKFRYESLLEKMEHFNNKERLINLFKELNTSDFEKVMGSIRNTKVVLSALEPELLSKFDHETHIKSIKESFLRTIHEIHPPTYSEIELTYAIDFLKNFDNIFTLNYDLMLYWIIMEMHRQHIRQNDDGFFRQDQNEPLEWNMNPNQNLFYLHGALHIYLHNPEEITFKSEYKIYEPLITQLKKCVDSGYWPIVVLEGTAHQKFDTIHSFSYLKSSLQSLENIKGSIFIHGSSFNEQDHHIFNAIFSNSNLKIFIGYFDEDKNLENNIQNRIRIGKGVIENIVYYDAKTVPLTEK